MTDGLAAHLAFFPWINRCFEIVRHDMLDYALEVEHADSHHGRMIAELEKRGLLENTLISPRKDVKITACQPPRTTKYTAE